MDAENLDEARELLLGTWIGVAIVVEMLIARQLVHREELMLLLSQAQTASSDRRSTAFAALRLLIERGFG